MENKDIFPRSVRILIWVIVVAVATMIVLTGYIAVQVEEIDQEVFEIRQSL